jgi:hypothetical protein
MAVKMQVLAAILLGLVLESAAEQEATAPAYDC